MPRLFALARDCRARANAGFVALYLRRGARSVALDHSLARWSDCTAIWLPRTGILCSTRLSTSTDCHHALGAPKRDLLAAIVLMHGGLARAVLLAVTAALDLGALAVDG